ncbi:hypothetical protein H257_13850 [Aphanomyces astaci]|uniref:Uncharacterized protein n=1 Tax=Aphanomyces astaci TaxID=112090 RepID=W4FVC5_APHAT|nr:hypothetical protein H257_13850 [Aphanomyces astaci]ETV70764.1 hypothetical protein H257_13850 [Aphanomyces astaci]|eukprot:XP_009839828.1 hypothetical protein H257_13850 [Aphanomyces astaci]
MADVCWTCSTFWLAKSVFCSGFWQMAVPLWMPIQLVTIESLTWPHMVSLNESTGISSKCKMYLPPARSSAAALHLTRATTEYIWPLLGKKPVNFSNDTRSTWNAPHEDPVYVANASTDAWASASGRVSSMPIHCFFWVSWVGTADVGATGGLVVAWRG